MEEKKNNAVEKVENAISGENSPQEDNSSRPDEKESLSALREKRRIEKDKLSALKFRERVRLKEQKLLKNKEEKEREHRLKALSIKARNEEREKRALDRKRRRDKNAGKGGYIAAIISLGIATLILSSVLTFTFLMPTESDNQLEASYQRSFYDVVEQVNNMDLNLSKTLATKDSASMQGYLMDLAINSELAESNIQQLPLKDENKYYTAKLINQIGDYAKYLNKKLANGEKLSKEELSTLSRLYNANLSLKDTLYKSLSNMDKDFTFSSLENESDNFFLQNLGELQNLSVEYPELIYDGPFSDGVDRKEIKGLPLSETNEAGAQDEFVKIFGNYGLSDVAVQGETQGTIGCFNVTAQVNDDNLFAQISKRGGKLIMFEYAGSCQEVNYLEDSAREEAENFLTSQSISNMKAVWCNLDNNVYTFNFAYENDGIIFYSDLIKIRVCAETKMVIGFEATSYYTNHTERLVPTATISENKAKEFVFEELVIQNSRLALIPIGTSSEKLCYEFECERDGQTFYVYIDATNGKQVEMFKVVESSDGKLLA